MITQFIIKTIVVLVVVIDKGNEGDNGEGALLLGMDLDLSVDMFVCVCYV